MVDLGKYPPQKKSPSAKPQKQNYDDERAGDLLPE